MTAMHAPNSAASIPAWKGTRGVRSTSAKARRSTKLPSSNLFAPRWRPTLQRARNGQPRRSKPGSQSHLNRFHHNLQEPGTAKRRGNGGPAQRQ
jgi:hypothetical protein